MNEISASSVTTAQAARAPRRWLWLDAVAILAFAACVSLAPFCIGQIPPMAMLTVASGLWILWIGLTSALLLLHLVRATRNLWRRSRRIAPLGHTWRPTVLVTIAVLVPIAASAGIWTAHWRATRALHAAFQHCERLFDEMEQHHAQHGSYPGTLAELPSFREGPSFLGHIDYSGGGPTMLSLQDDRNTPLPPLVWSFDSAEKKWKSWDPF